MLGQVRTSWQWHRTLLANIAASEKEALRLNLDETSIVLNHDDQKGVVTPQTDKLPVLVPKKYPKRGSLTHVVLICDDTAVQPLLPQMIIGNEHILRVADMQILEILVGEIPGRAEVQFCAKSSERLLCFFQCMAEAGQIPDTDSGSPLCI